MDALNVISVDEAKEVLVVDFGGQEEIIERYIKASVSLVEAYTCHYLYQREKTYRVFRSSACISDYPIEVKGVVNRGSTVQYTTRSGTLDLTVYAQSQSIITACIGYTERSEIPQPLISACLKIIVSMYDNRDNYPTSLPNDVQLLLNPFRRSATI